MTSSNERPVDQIEAEASAWAAKLDADPQDDFGLDEWIASDPRHGGSLLRAQAALAMFEPFEGEEAFDAIAPQPRRPQRRGLMFGAATALAACVGGLLMLAPQTGSKATIEEYHTDVGEIRTLALQDGSSVSIDAKTELAVEFERKGRSFHMGDGRALFRATHDKDRPFQVLVGNVTVTDIGTAFQITNDSSAGTVEVLVTEGAVYVDSPAGRARLVAGQKGIFAQSAQMRTMPVAAVDGTSVERAVAWREGRIELDGETLSDAVGKFNRYSRVPITIGNAALGRERLFGSFRADDPAGFARAAAASLGTSARVGNEAIVIGTPKN